MLLAKPHLILGYSVFLNNLWTYGQKVYLFIGTTCYVKNFF
jgi:hypothetical protein